MIYLLNMVIFHGLPVKNGKKNQHLVILVTNQPVV